MLRRAEVAVGGPGDQPPRTLAEKLDRLFKTVRPAGRGEYTYEEVATALAERGDPGISRSYVWQLRKGTRDNPTKKHLEALASFFGVPPTYFFDDEAATRIDAELDLLAAMRDDTVRRIALRAADLSPLGLRALSDMVERVRQLEGLPDQPDQPDPPGQDAQTPQRAARPHRGATNSGATVQQGSTSRRRAQP